MKFWHVFPDSSHLLSLAKSLAEIDSRDGHEILVLPANGHKRSYIAEAQSIWGQTKPFSGNLSCGPQDITIIHSLFLQTSFDIATQLLQQRAHVVWCVWGGDLHMLATAPGGVEFLNRFSCMISFYGETILYPKLTTPEVLGTCYKSDAVAAEEGGEKEKLIVLGNSGDPSNDHLYLLELASRFKEHRFHLPFAYNVTPEYRQSILQKAEELGMLDRLTLQEEMLPINEYNSIIARAEMVFTAHHRQQGLGLLCSAYLNNCRVFMRHVITTPSGETMANPGYMHLLSYGYVDVADICSLEDEDLRCTIEAKPLAHNKTVTTNMQSKEGRAAVYERVKHACYGKAPA
uniref:RB124 n=1 Tax=Ruegeria sp. PR1b TaxID=185588 RepID=Q8KWB8_9RHOB|nr:TDP-N-acetylfucosamine:lipid II N-acetylfucosaminyltransferase [Ruegeria sp. PR1b]AAN05145.1 RB124 [Ruegeria sp. PR1b]